MKRAALVLFSTLLALSAGHVRALEHGTNVEVRIGSTQKAVISEAAKESLALALRNAGSALGDGQSLVVTLDGYFVRPGSTTAVLRQLGGRDIARGHLALASANGELRDLGEFFVGLRSEGFANKDFSIRQAHLHQAIARSVANQTR